MIDIKVDFVHMQRIKDWNVQLWDTSEDDASKLLQEGPQSVLDASKSVDHSIDCSAYKVDTASDNACRRSGFVQVELDITQLRYVNYCVVL